MGNILPILALFGFRLTFGVALAMGITPSKLVTSGFYRIHLWVLMGVNTLAVLAVYTARDSYVHIDWRVIFGLAISLVVASYAGSVMWLYEKSRHGARLLYFVALAALIAAALATFAARPPMETTGWIATLIFLDLISSGLLLGVTLSAMFLGHWYLNTPTMNLVPLKRLVLLMVSAIAVRTIVSAVGLSLHMSSTEEELSIAWWMFIGLRWVSGLLGTLMLALLTWRTLKVPNTQSATGILYAGVILAFIGELTSMLLSVDTLYPV